MMLNGKELHVGREEWVEKSRYVGKMGALHPSFNALPPLSLFSCSNPISCSLYFTLSVRHLPLSLSWL
jgi:hypothetical protein